MSGLVRGDALRLPFADESVDLIVTSPPYFALRSYQDDGEHYGGQIGSEPHWSDFIDALLTVTAECARVLKPSGSIFVNLGDKYSGAGGPGGDYNAGGLKAGQPRHQASDYWSKMAPAKTGIPAKSLMMLPERYRIGCVDRLGLIARAVVVWDKPNGLPESVTDRVRRSHEDWVHLTKRGSYYAAVDEIREAHAPGTLANAKYTRKVTARAQPGSGASGTLARAGAGYNDALNPLGKLPGSVWTVPTEPLQVPDFMAVSHPKDMRPPFLDEKGASAWARHMGLDVDGFPVSPWPRPDGPHVAAAPDHFAAFPTEWPRRLILGWSPPGVCVGCGEGRRPVVEKTKNVYYGEGKFRSGAQQVKDGAATVGWKQDEKWTTEARITGEQCACPDTSAPTRPAVILDCFGGTGTTAMVANSLGRFGVSVDLSADYLRLARWRVEDSGHGQKAGRRSWEARQGGLFEGVA